VVKLNLGVRAFQMCAPRVDLPRVPSIASISAIQHDVERLAFGALLQEGALWLAILRRDPPPGWTQQTLRNHEEVLADLREVFADRTLGTNMCSAAQGWLIGYCMTMRGRNGGASASDILQHRRGGAPADRADRRWGHDAGRPADERRWPGCDRHLEAHRQQAA
jgi:hypothetical protein